MKILHAIAYGVFGYYKEKGREKQNEFDFLSCTDLLHSSDYLEEMYRAANGDKAKEDIILDHINKHAAYEVDSYKLLESKIVNKRWRG
jgi:hypothetical protein